MEEFEIKDGVGIIPEGTTEIGELLLKIMTVEQKK